jgi:hypothetical protein
VGELREAPEEDRPVGLRWLMWYLSSVKSIEYRGRRVFHIEFDDGLEGDVDF